MEVLFNQRLLFSLRIELFLNKAKLGLGLSKWWSKNLNDSPITRRLCMTLVRLNFEFLFFVFNMANCYKYLRNYMERYLNAYITFFVPFVPLGSRYRIISISAKCVVMWASFTIPFHFFVGKTRMQPCTAKGIVKFACEHQNVGTGDEGL